MPSDAFNPGFRLSALDVLVLILGGSFAASIAIAQPWFGVAVAFAISHFFLFCNIVRMRRSLELIWAATFVVLAISTVVLNLWSWPTTLGMSLALTTVLITVELRKPSYHGAFWRLLNPGLPEWWERKRADNEREKAE